MTTHERLAAVWSRIEAEDEGDIGLEYLWLCFYRLLGAPQRGR